MAIAFLFAALSLGGVLVFALSPALCEERAGL